MASVNDFEARDRYRDLMIEAKARAISINSLTSDQRGIPSPLIREYGILQVRMLLEIIGLACLVAHGDLVAHGPANLRKAYAPGEIFSALDVMHDDFFPVPMTPQQTEGGWHMAEYAGEPFLGKQEVKTLWDQCGRGLHKGSLKQLVSQDSPIQADFADVSDAGQKIMNLLGNHRMIRKDRQIAFITMLENGDGQVQVEIGEAVADQV